MKKPDQKRTTTTAQISRSLDLVATKLATERGITKSEALDQLFGALYPEAHPAETLIAPATPESEPEAEAEPNPFAGIPPVPETASSELKRTAGDLAAVHTITGLSRSLEEVGKPKPLTAKEMMEWRALMASATGKDPAGGEREPEERVGVRAELNQLREEIKTMFTDHAKSDLERENIALRQQLEEKESAEKRAAELQPLYEEIGKLGLALSQLEATMKEDKQPPTSPELEAIRATTESVKALAQKIGEQPGKPTPEREKLSDYLDELTVVLDKLAVFGKRAGEGGELDWRTAGITGATEVATEAIRAFSEVRGGAGEKGEGEREVSKPDDITLRRVYNYAMKRIASGKLDLNTQETADALGLTPRQVFDVIETLKQQGLLSSEAMRGTKGAREKKGEKTTGEEMVEGD